MCDFNWDGIDEIFISNDLSPADCLYARKSLDSSFSNHLVSAFDHISNTSMGCATADINNDLLPDLFVLDMLADKDDIRKSRLNMSPNAEELVRRNGGVYQVSQNVLQINKGNLHFTEQAFLKGLSATDWSWSPIIADFNNDGQKDIFVTTSYPRDLLNLDYQNYKAKQLIKANPRLKDKTQAILDLFHTQPKTAAANRLIILDSTLKEVAVNDCSGFQVNTNGAACGDLDLDGDLDLILNNFDTTSFILENTTNSILVEKQFIEFSFNSEVNPALYYGAKVVLFSGNTKQLSLLTSTTGFQSSQVPVAHFGLGKNKTVDSVLVILRNGEQLNLIRPEANRLHEINKEDLAHCTPKTFKPKSLQKPHVTKAVALLNLVTEKDQSKTLETSSTI